MAAEKRWIINRDDGEGRKLLAARPCLKSLTVRYPEGQEETHTPEGEQKQGGATTYLRILQMLTAHVADEGWMEKKLLEGKFNSDGMWEAKYAISGKEYEKRKQEQIYKTMRYRKLSEPPYSQLPDIYVSINLGTTIMEKRLTEIVKALEETRRAEGKPIPELEVCCEVDRAAMAAVDAPTAQEGCPFGLNTILYGPPGTGKTYLSRTYAVAIADGLSLEQVKQKYPHYEKQEGEDNNEDGSVSICGRYAQLESERRVRMVTFHQAYGYEEFIQGIRPEIKKKNPTEEKGSVEEKDPAEEEKEKAKSGELKYEIRPGTFTDFCRMAREDTQGEDTQGEDTPGGEKKQATEPYIFIIDEINRGNIAKIFGELITLIEPSKRSGAEEELVIRLPYDGEGFSVPKNVYLLGTMNTADRSLALLDTALRRRFDFVEMMPDPHLLAGVTVEGISIETLLKNLNERLELLIDREHTIGHAFFMPLKKDPSMKTLARIMKQKVIPLLQEFFYDDYEQLQQVLGKKIVVENTDKALKSRLESRTDRELGKAYRFDWGEGLGAYGALERPEAYQELLGKERETPEPDTEPEEELSGDD